MKLLIIMMFMGFLTGCDSVKGEATVQANSNPDLKVHKLSTVDNCIIYRFYDSGVHYFVKCFDGAPTVVSSKVDCGEDCVRIEDIQTLIKKR